MRQSRQRIRRRLDFQDVTQIVPGAQVVCALAVQAVELQDHGVSELLPGHFKPVVFVVVVVTIPSELVAHAVEFVPGGRRAVVVEVRVLAEELVDVVGRIEQVCLITSLWFPL